MQRHNIALKACASKAPSVAFVMLYWDIYKTRKAQHPTMMSGVSVFKFVAPNVASKMASWYVLLQPVNRKQHFATVVPINRSKAEMSVRQPAFHVRCWPFPVIMLIIDHLAKHRLTQDPIIVPPKAFLWTAVIIRPRGNWLANCCWWDTYIAYQQTQGEALLLLLITCC